MDKSTILRLFILAMVMSASYVMVIAAGDNVPTGPDTITDGTNTRKVDMNYTGPILAEAGNVTALLIDTARQTKSWQGYYGNITGRIVLDDALNYTFFSWALEKPRGEIFAVNSSFMNWLNLECLSHNLTGPNPSGSRINYSSLELFYSMNASDFDGINETFNQTFIGEIYVGAKSFSYDNNCSVATMYVNEGWQNTQFMELILTDNYSVAFTALIEDQQAAYISGLTADFQMLVAENGHPGFEGTFTPYYFYVELE